MIQSVWMKTKYKHIDVDDFLKRVIVSDKFNEMAEMIADKAVAKLQKLRNEGIAVEPDINSNNKDAVYRANAAEIKETNLKTENVIKNSTDTSYDHRKTSEKTPIDRIDAQAFMKKVESSLKDVSLKYKYFTKGLNTQVYKEEDDGTKINLEDTPLTKEKNSDEDTIPVREAKEKIKSSISNENDEYVTKIDSKQSENNDEHKMSKESLKSDRKISQTKTESHENSDSESTELGEIKKADNTRTKDESTEYISRKPTYEYLQLPLTNTKTDIKNVEVNPKVTAKENKTKKKDLLQGKGNKEDETNNWDEKGFYKRSLDMKLHKEGNKFYTHKKDPDYDEYHQEVARIEKQLKMIK